jgi:hypothetical protein
VGSYRGFGARSSEVEPTLGVNRPLKHKNQSVMAST